jgi:hypothetical protein
MRKFFSNTSLFLLALSFGLSSNAQLLTVGSESEMTILGGTDFAVDQLVLVPNRDYSIKNNSIELTKSKMFKEGNSVSRTYIFRENPLPFYGTVLMGVSASEKNQSYSLQLFDNIQWNALATKASLSNPQLLEGAVSSGRVTKAITVGQTDGKGDFEILTNPAVNRIVTVQINKAGEYQFLSADGKLLLNQKFAEGIHQVNLSRFAHATYLLTNRISSKLFIL